MGYLTPVLLYNDSMHQFVKDPNINHEIQNASFDAERSRNWGRPEDAFYRTRRHSKLDKVLAFFGLQRINPKTTLKNMGGSGSCALVLRPQHADCNRVLVVTGNGFVDLSDIICHKEELDGLDRGYIKIVKDLISYYNRKERAKK